MNEQQLTLESLKTKVANLEEIIKNISRRTDINDNEINSIKTEIADIRIMITKLEIISSATHDKVDEVNVKIEKMSDQTYEQLKELTSTLTQLVMQDNEHVRKESTKSSNFSRRVIWYLIGSGGIGAILATIIELLLK